MHAWFFLIILAKLHTGPKAKSQFYFPIPSQHGTHTMDENHFVWELLHQGVGFYLSFVPFPFFSFSYWFITLYCLWLACARYWSIRVSRRRTVLFYLLQTLVVLQACQPCRTHTYQEEIGQTNCTACPTGTFSKGDGSTDLENCSLCSDEIVCHGHGKCKVTYPNDKPDLACNCSFFYRAADSCKEPTYLFVLIGCVVGVLAIIAGAVFAVHMKR